MRNKLEHPLTSITSSFSSLRACRYLGNWFFLLANIKNTKVVFKQLTFSCWWKQKHQFMFISDYYFLFISWKLMIKVAKSIITRGSCIVVVQVSLKILRKVLLFIFPYGPMLNNVPRGCHLGFLISTHTKKSPNI